VLVHLFLDEAVAPIGNGRTQISTTYFTKLYANNSSEFVQFIDLAGNVGMTGVLVDRIQMPDQSYGYNGSYQTFIAPQDGDYLIELRGAQGANSPSV
jgi:hypothetical protein